MEYPAELEALVMRCLEKNPNDRFQNARDIQASLETFAREYQLTLSTLSFSTFLEPLLEDARVAAEERWKNRRHDAMPIHTTTTERIRDVQVPLAHPMAALPSLPSVTGPANQSPFDDEPMTARVPEDMLAQLRSEERELALSEQRKSEDDAVPRFTAASTSNHVVRRASSPSVEIATDEILEPRASTPIPEADQVWESSTRARSQDRAKLGSPRHGSTEMVAPLAMPAAELSDDDMRVTRKTSGLWITGLVASAAVATGAYAFSRDTKAASEAPAPVPRAEVSSLVVAGEAGADVWMFLGRTPIQTLAINNESEHRIRLEHEGYRSVERTLDARSWQRDASGSQFAEARITLHPVGEDAPLSDEPPEEPLASVQARPASLRVQSSPTAANAWLFVGTTPNVKVGNLDTSEEVQLRIERPGRPPSFRVVHPAEFSASGQTRIEIHSDPVAPAGSAADALAAPLPDKRVRGTGSPDTGSPSPKGKRAKRADTFQAEAEPGQEPTSAQPSP